MAIADEKPAILGGNPVRPQGPPPWPLDDPEVAEALHAAIRDRSWGKYHGPNVTRLEDALRTAFAVEYALTCGSGTFAVELALRALKIQPGDEVILAGYDYPGNFLSIHVVGARPVLVDVAPDNWNLDVRQLAGAFSPHTRAILVSHLHGGLVPMRGLIASAHARGLAVIEDAAQCPGAVIEGTKAGSWGDVGILSFGGSKLLSAGRGGALLTHRADVVQRARTWNLRGNLVCPLSELQAAVLLPQIAKLDARNVQRSAAVRELTERLRDFPGLTAFANQVNDSQAGYYKLGFQYDAARLGLDRRRLLEAVRAEGIALDEGFRAAHIGRSPKRFRAIGELPEATRAHEGTIILHHPVLLEPSDALAEVVASFRKIQAHSADLRAAGVSDPEA
jgi:perosamine synthetase